MLEISVETQNVPEELLTLLPKVVDAACKVEGVENISAFLRIVDDETIHQINKETRNVDRPTDVLSFPTVNYPKGKTAHACPKRLHREYDAETGTCFMGDFVLSLETAERQAQEYGHSLQREAGYLTAHAMLHLFGYDHMVEEEKAVMRAMEEKVMQAVALFRVSDEELFQMATDAMQNAYAPYSHYRVGACILADDGRTFTGCNIENASYGATLCAERCAVCNAISGGAKRFVAIAVVGETSDAWPCGVCRQVLNEFSDSMRVICGTAGKPSFTVVPLKDLLPHSFGPSNLDGAKPE